MKIATLSTYPIDEPRHGGQHRLYNIAAQYRLAGHIVESFGILGSSEYIASKGFLHFPDSDQLRRAIGEPFLMEDYAIGKIAAEEDETYSKLAAYINDFNPDIIHVEQPWLFEFTSRFCKEFHKTSRKVIYGSQNVENSLKHRIVFELSGRQRAEACRSLVFEVEANATLRADMVCCVSQHDVEWAQKNSASRTILAANGVVERQLNMTGLTASNSISGHRKNVLFCASSHLPNITGFYDLFRKGIGFLSPEERLVVAGGAASAIRANEAFDKTPGLSKHFVGAGVVTEECLSGLIATAHTIVLPITSGGGTNLKTAEAIWAAKHVVATPQAMRGFEAFIGAPGITVCEKPSDFKSAVLKSMASPELEISKEERIRRRIVLWEKTLESLTKAVDSLLT